MSILGILSAQQPTASGERKRADGRSVTGVVARLAMTLAAGPGPGWSVRQS